MAAYAFNILIIDFVRQLFGFGLGCTLLHSTFCILNDICDRDLDGLVERTKTRPLVSGAFPLSGALVLFAGFLAATAGVLLFANSQAVAFGLLSVPLHFLYPTSKRWTWWPQAWLGISNGWSFFVGWFSIAASQSSRENVISVLSMYGAMICWTIYFDTIYATQDREDDARIGVLSTARLFGTWLREFTTVLAICTTFLLLYAGTLNRHGVLYYVLSCGGAMCHFLWQIASWDPNNSKSSGKIFKSNGDLGLIVFAGMVADYAYKKYFSSF
jgi:4-hydroxybenzoate polyprenyltransferase